MRERRWLLLALYGLLLATAVTGALKATRPKFKIATTSTTTTTTEEPDVSDNENGENEATTVSSDVNATTGHTLTGIPQIDYIWDPNLPRELNGFNLSDYPFYSGIPEEINFKCDGLHDGFYASVPHKCQVYHHCLFGTRFDFLCANFTAFDQKTFICHFASEVDCANSKKYWHRNDALYKAAETTTTSTSTTSTTTTSTAAPPPAQGRRPGRLSGGRRPFRRRPAYDYYEEDYYDDEAGYERTRPRGYDRRDDYDYEDRKYTRRDRERDRDFRDRDYRDRDLPRSRDPDLPRARDPDLPRSRDPDLPRARDPDLPRSRDPDHPRVRDPDRPLRDSERPIKEDVPLSPRERFPSRNNRRDPPRAAVAREPLDDEPRNRNRDQDPPVRVRDPEDLVDDKKIDTRGRDVEDRRYSDKGIRDDYEDEPVAAGPVASTGNAEVLVKPAAPVSSVYARPRAPPKIRRPVPLTEQEKFSYKATSAPPIAGEARRRPADIPAEDDYYEDEIEEVRTRRPATRRRPGFRDFYESPRERDRDRPFRSRYRDDEEDIRPRKHPERIRGDEDVLRPRKHPQRSRGDEDDEVRPRKHPERSRERYYERGPERGRDRSLDRQKERSGTARHQEERPERREKEIDSPRSPVRSKEPVEIPESTRRPNIYDRTSVAPPIISTTSTEAPKESTSSQSNSPERPDRPFRSGNRQDTQSSPVRTVPGHSKPEGQSARQNPLENIRDQSSEADKPQSPREDSSKHQENPPAGSEKQRSESEEYSSVEYYDEPEYPPPPPPRTAIRVVKRPFLPSRGGNPNPRGLLPVGSKAPESSRKEETQSSRSGQVQSGQNHSGQVQTGQSHSGQVQTGHQSHSGQVQTGQSHSGQVQNNPSRSEQVQSAPGRSGQVQSSPNRPGKVQSGPSHSDDYRNAENQERSQISDDEKRTYDAYKFIQTDVNQKTRADEYEDVLSRPNVRRPIDENEDPANSKNDNNSDSLRNGAVTRGRNQEETNQPTKSDSGVLRPVGRTRNQEDSLNDHEKPALKWNSDEYRQGQRGDVRHETDSNSPGQNRPKPRLPVTENSGYYSDTYANDNRDLPSGPTGNSNPNKQIINEVVTHHRLQDIPESEYDVTLNEALTPSFSNQEGNLPSGFVLPIHRQIGRDTVLQSTENSYKVSRPYNQQSQQQKAFVPSPQFLPLTDIGSGNERSRSVQYFRTPEAVHVTGPQYRHQRGPWHDYTGY